MRTQYLEMQDRLAAGRTNERKYTAGVSDHKMVQFQPKKKAANVGEDLKELRDVATKNENAGFLKKRRERNLRGRTVGRRLVEEDDDIPDERNRMYFLADHA